MAHEIMVTYLPMIFVVSKYGPLSKIHRCSVMRDENPFLKGLQRTCAEIIHFPKL
mgnify:CR=1 FL=1